MSRAFSRGANSVDVNPYIALSDLMINMVMCFVFLTSCITVLGRLGSDDIKYKKQRETIDTQLKTIPAELRPVWVTWKNDVAGVQRWVFSGNALFEPESTSLTTSGRETLLTFLKVLKGHRNSWTRLRIEGHSLPPIKGKNDDFLESAVRASAVARVLSGAGGVEPNFLVVSGKAGQDVLYPLLINGKVDPRNERVEIIIEFGSTRSQ